MYKVKNINHKVLIIALLINEVCPS